MSQALVNHLNQQGINILMDKTQLNKVWQRADYFIGFGFGSGLMPIAPGTWGTLAALPLLFLMVGLEHWLYAVIVLASFIIGCQVSDTISRELAVDDYSGIVWDEVVGYMITMFLAPTGLLWMVIGFLLFRFFDIIKPFPIGWVDSKIKGGLGVMLDDVIAGVFAWCGLQLLTWFVGAL